MICSCSDRTPCHIGDCGDSTSRSVCRFIDHEEDRCGKEWPRVDDGAVAGDLVYDDSEENGRNDAEKGDGGIKEEDQLNDNGLCKYEQLRLKCIARNNARLTKLGLNNDWEEKKSSKRRSAPTQPRQSLALEGLRRKNLDRAKRATAFNELEMPIEDLMK